MGPKLKTSKPFRGKIMDGRSSISSYFSKAVPVPDPAPAPAPAPAPCRPIWEGLPDVGEHLRAGGEQPSPSAGNGTGGWKPWNSRAMSVEPAAEGERGELSTPPSSFYSMDILGADDKGDGDVLTPERSRGKGKARAANDQPGKWARTTPPSPGFDVAHARLEPHQTEVFDKMTAAMGDTTFASNRAKIDEIARQVAKDKGMCRDSSVNDVLREACGEYGLHRVLALDQLGKRPLGYDEMGKGGIEVFDARKDYGGQVNYVHAYEFFCKKTTLAMVEAWESEMGVGSALCGSVRAKANRHDWDDKGALRLLISGEGLSASVYKYARGLQQPPTAVRARQPRQANGRVANDGPAWNVPAGLVLVGGDALDRVGTETYVWRTGDPHRSSRELHEAILALVFLGGLVWCPESVGLNQKVGGTFNDEQRARGGTKSIAKRKENPDKYKDDCSRGGRIGGAASTLYDCEKGNDGRSLSSEQGASRRPTDTSAQWMDHTVDEPLQAEAATCSNCEEPRELSGFFYGGGRRRVVVLDHMVGGESGGVRCKKYPKKPRGVFKPTNENVETITKDGLLKAVKREAKRVST